MCSEGNSLDDIYFPVSTMVSFFVNLSDGYSIEALSLGKKNVIGIAVPIAGCKGVMKVRDEGLSYKISRSKFNEISLNSAAISQMTSLYLVSIIELMMRNIACAKHHQLNQQLSRWILNKIDSTERHDIRISHAQLSQSLGVRREAISLTLAELSTIGAVVLKRNHVEIIDRGLLEKIVSECYGLKSVH